MSDPVYNFPLERRPWNQRWFCCALAILALALDYALGPLALFPVLFLVPIMLAAWHFGPPFATGLAVVMSFSRFGFFFLWHPSWTLLEAALNTLFRCLVLVLIALLTAYVARFHRALRQRVKTLEGILPICCFCKRIRDEHQHWRQLEAYIATRSEARFSHSICPQCLKQHYGELVSENRNL